MTWWTAGWRGWQCVRSPPSSSMKNRHALINQPADKWTSQLMIWVQNEYNKWILFRSIMIFQNSNAFFLIIIQLTCLMSSTIQQTHTRSAKTNLNVFLSRFKFKEMLKHMVFNEMNLLLWNFEKSLKKLKILWYHFNAVKTNAQMEIRKSLLVCRHIHFNWKSHVFLWLWNELNSVSDHLEIKSKSWKSFVWSSEFKPPKIKSETVSESLEKTWTWVTVYCQITSRLRREKDTLTSNM